MCGPSGWLRSGELDAVADEKGSEALLEVALGLAVAWGVGIEGGSERRAPGVAAAEDAGDVVGADVVLELGLGEGLEQRPSLVSRRQVEQGAGHGGAGEAAVLGHVVGA